MAAPKKNSFWKLRSKHGRDKLFSTPEMLLAVCYEYFEHCDSNPWYRNEAVKSGQDVGKIINIPIQRPYSLSGLAHYLNTDEKTLRHYGSTTGYEDFFPVLTHVKQIIDTNQFEGATVGAYNANIIARKLGLVDKQDLTTKGDKVTPQIITTLTPDELRKTLEK
jgi:hypothetical protein